MWVQCETCQRSYDDAECWTLCPHGPLWARLDAYDPKTDCVQGVTMRDEPVEGDGNAHRD